MGTHATPRSGNTPPVPAAQVFIALGFLAATIGVPLTFGGRAINLGFVAATALAAAAGLLERRALSSLANNMLPRALGVGVLAFVAPAFAHGLDGRTILAAGRGCAVLAWFALLVALGAEQIKPSLRKVALLLLVGNIAMALFSHWLPDCLYPFEITMHEYVRGLPRFRGFANTPAPAGVWALVCVGLSEASPRAVHRWAGRALGLLETCATLSIGLLAVPAVLAALLRPTRLRRPAVCTAAIFAAAVLYFQPLELVIRGHHYTLSRLHSNYTSEGLGPAYMPTKTFTMPGLALVGHATAYGELAARGFTCFAEHPLLGVGPGRFRTACKVMAMNTFGEWTDQRDSHNQLGGLASELGSVGVGLLIYAGLTLRRAYTLSRLTRWQVAVWVGLLVCALGSENLLTLPVLALLATQLAPRATVGQPALEPGRR